MATSQGKNTELNFSLFEFNWPVERKTATGRKWQTDVDFKAIGNIGFYSSFISEGSHIILRYYAASRLVTVDLQEPKQGGLFTPSVVDKMLVLLKTRFGVQPLRQYFTLPRVSDVPRLYCTSDERVMVYDFDKVLCDVQSQYQRIKILHSNEFGNTLILDDFVNLAEKDLVYTEQLMWKGSIPYTGKDVLVLGGGDGGVLNEVLKENPLFVTMVEIDSTVVDLCKQYLRGACGDSLDSMAGPRHEIIIDDCFNQLEKYAAAGRQFDVIFSDLTDVPLVREGDKGRREFWSLMRRALEMGLRVLKPNGCFLTHLVGLSASDVISEYEKMLNDWTSPALKFDRAEVMVPSFLEVWTFYSISIVEARN